MRVLLPFSYEKGKEMLPFQGEEGAAYVSIFIASGTNGSCAHVPVLLFGPLASLQRQRGLLFGREAAKKFRLSPKPNQQAIIPRSSLIKNLK